MLGDELSQAEGDELIASAVADLKTVLEKTPQAESTSVQIVRAKLSGPLNDRSWDVLIGCLGAFVGTGAAYLVSWVAFGNWEERLARVSELALPDAPEADRFVRELIGLWGDQIQRAMTLRSQSPDDWVGITTNVLANLLFGEYRIKVNIEKVSGNVVDLEGPPDSILNLTRHLVSCVTAIGDADAISQDRIDSFRDEVKALEALLAKRQSAAAVSPEAENVIPNADKVDVVTTAQGTA
jgi:hypothetical protein